MGDPLSVPTLQAFADELEALNMLKTSGYLAGLAEGAKNMAKGFAKNTRSVLERASYPVEGMKEGFRMLSPAHQLRTGTGSESAWLAGAMKAQKEPGVSKFTRNFGPGLHLEAPGQPIKQTLQSSAPAADRAQQVAEELSRQGWTGRGRFTKYVPLGDKSQVAVGGAFAVPGIAHAVREGDTGRGGAGEQTGQALGGIGTGILTAGTGAPGILASIAAGHYAGKIGRKFDQRRLQQIAQPSVQPQQLLEQGAV